MSLFILVFCFSGPDSFWEELDHVVDAYEVIHHVDLESNHDNSMVGAVDQMVVHHDSLIIVDSSTNQLKRFSLSGKFLGLIGARGKGPGEYDQPARIAIAPNGDLYLYDRSSINITVYGNDYLFKRKFKISFQGLKRTIFPRGIQVHKGRFYTPLDMNYSKTQLIEIDSQGNILQALKNSKEKVPELFVRPRITFIDDQIWLNRVTHSTCRIWHVDSMMGKPRELNIRGYPNMIDEANFDFSKNTYDGISLRKRWYGNVNTIRLIANIDNRYVMVGQFRFKFPDPNAEAPEPGTPPEELMKMREPTKPYVNIYRKDGTLLRSKIGIKENRWPLEPVFLLSNHDPKHLFFYTWREDTEQNPLVLIYRYKGSKS